MVIADAFIQLNYFNDKLLEQCRVNLLKGTMVKAYITFFKGIEPELCLLATTFDHYRPIVVAHP